MQKLNRIKWKLCKWSEASAPQRADSFSSCTRAPSHDSNLLKRLATAHVCETERDKMLQSFFSNSICIESDAPNATETHTHKFTNLLGHPRRGRRAGEQFSVWHKWCADCSDTLLMYTQRWCMELTEATPKIMFEHFPESSCGCSDSSLLSCSRASIPSDRLVRVMRYGHLFQTKAQFLRTSFYVSTSGARRREVCAHSYAPAYSSTDKFMTEATTPAT